MSKVLCICVYKISPYICTYIYTYLYIYVCPYICIYREREREGELDNVSKGAGHLEIWFFVVGSIQYFLIKLNIHLFYDSLVSFQEKSKDICTERLIEECYLELYS